jgi:two-component system response regulator YesN
MMEGMDGIELIKTCRVQYPDIRFIVLSNYNDFENVKRAMKCGASDYIFKLTANPEDLLRVIKEVDAEGGGSAEGKPEGRSEAEVFLKKNLSPIRTRLLKTAIQRSYPSLSEFRKELSLAGAVVDFSREYVVFQIAIDCFFEKLLHGDITEPQMLVFTMENMVKEIVEKRHPADVYGYDNGQIIVVAECAAREYIELSKTMEDVFRTIKEYLRRYLGISVSAILSGVCVSVDDLAAAVAGNENALHGYLWGESGTFSTVNATVREGVRRVMEHISSHIRDALPLAALAEMANMSESYFSHIFKKETGIGVNDYINRQRVIRAEKLLRESSLKISAISAEVGIENSNYFSVLFKRLTGRTPIAYRLASKGKEDRSKELKE